MKREVLTSMVRKLTLFYLMPLTEMAYSYSAIRWRCNCGPQRLVHLSYNSVQKRTRSLR